MKSFSLQPAKSLPRIMKRIIASLVFIAVSIAGVAQTLGKTGQQIVALIDKNYQQTISLLKASVDINSGTFNVKGVRQVGTIYAKELAAIGFDTTWIAMPDSLKRAGHLVATRTGKKGKKLFLIGHLDTVFEPDMPANPFAYLNDSTATGQGVSDMKGGDVLVIASLKALHQLHLLDDATITVYFTGDEENSGDPKSVSRGDFIARAQQHDIALAFEGALGMNTVCTARRGSSSWKLEVKAKQAHSSGVFGNGGYGSIYEASRIIDAFRKELGNEAYLTFNPGLFLGGSEVAFNEAALQGEVSGKINIISPKTVVMGDLRFLTEEQKERARTKMKEIVSQNLPGATASISFKDGIPSMPPTEGNSALVKVVNDISLGLGYGAVKAGDPGARGAGDISYVAKYLDCMDGIGVSGHCEHAPGETINLKEFPMLTKRAALLIYRLTR
jgi:glutamate carboxypeptidase